MLKTNSTRVMARHCSIHSQRQTWNLRLDTETVSEENPFNKPAFFWGFHVVFLFGGCLSSAAFLSGLTLVLDSLLEDVSWVFSRWLLFLRGLCDLFWCTDPTLIQPASLGRRPRLQLPCAVVRWLKSWCFVWRALLQRMP